MTDSVAAAPAATIPAAPDSSLATLHRLAGIIEERTRTDYTAAIKASEGVIRADIAGLMARLPRHSHLLSLLAGAALALGIERGAVLAWQALRTVTGG